LDPEIVLKACLNIIDAGLPEKVAIACWRAQFPTGPLPSFVRGAVTAVEPVTMELTSKALAELTIETQVAALEGSLEIIAKNLMDGAVKTLTEQEFLALAKISAQAAEQAAARIAQRWTMRQIGVQTAKVLTLNTVRILSGALNVFLITPPAGAATLEDHRKYVEAHTPVTITTIRRRAYDAYRFRCLVYGLWTNKRVKPMQENQWFAMYFAPTLKRTLTAEQQRVAADMKRKLEATRFKRPGEM